MANSINLFISLQRLYMRLRIPLTFLLLINYFGLFSQINLSNGLLLYYNFNGNILDQSGNEFHAINFGDVGFTDDFNGVPLNAFQFNGVNGLLRINSLNPILKPTQFPITVTAWVKNNQDFGKANIIFKNDYAQNVYSGIRIQTGPSNGKVAVSFEDGGPIGTGSRRTKIGNTNINDNQWHSVACIIRSATDMDIYIDCNNDGGVYSGGGGNIAYTNNYGSIGVYDGYLGETQEQDFYKGSIDELRFYNRELNADELNFLAIGFVGNPFTLVNYSAFDSSITLNFGNQLLETFEGNILWDFGNGNQSQNNFGSFQYDSIGQYLVNLQLTSNNCVLNFDTIVVFEENPTFLHDELIDNNLSVFPNPAENKISVLNKNHEEICKIDIFDSLGQIHVKNQEINLSYFSINTSKLPIGIYFINCYFHNGKSSVKKFAIKH